MLGLVGSVGRRAPRPSSTYFYAKMETSKYDEAPPRMSLDDASESQRSVRGIDMTYNQDSKSITPWTEAEMALYDEYINELEAHEREQFAAMAERGDF